MSLFTPVTGILGGSLIGLSAAVLLLSNGDVLGCSGILSSSLLHPMATSNLDKRWKFMFLGCFVLTVKILLSASSLQCISPSQASTLAYGIGGFCVGLGTRLSNGCTSGHGVCGLARFSPRSLAAVISFMLSGIVTATTIASPLAPWASYTSILRQDRSTTALTSDLLSSLMLAAAGSLVAWSHFRTKTDDASASAPVLYSQKAYGAAVSGALFALGLGISGMSQTQKVAGFLDWQPLVAGRWEAYDPTLLTVLGSAVPISALAYWYRRSRPHCPADGIPTTIDRRLILGSLLFGLGWGLVGLCPGPGLWSAAAGQADVLFTWLPAFLGGSYLGERIILRPSFKKTTEEDATDSQ